MNELVLKAINIRFPSGREKGIALLLAASVLACAIFIYSIRGLMEPLYTGWLGLILGIILLVTIPLYKWAPLYALRMAMLLIPGIITGSFLLVSEPGTRVSYHALRFQTYEFATEIILLTVMALSASAIGWGLAIRRISFTGVSYRLRNFKVRFMIYAFIALIAGTLTADALGPFVWVAGYTSMAKEPLLKIGVFPALVVIGILGMYSLVLFDERTTVFHRKVFWLITIYALVICMLLRGMRLEVLAAIIAMYFVYYEVKLKKIKPVRLIILGLIAFIIVQAWGIFRVSPADNVGLSDAFTIAIETFSKKSYPAGGYIYSLGTISDIASTFYNTVGFMKDGILQPLYGRSYIEYIPRTLPEFIYPDRPVDLAWTFSTLDTGGGGFFELAEAYYNFGMFGVIAIPGILTFIFAKVYQKALTHRTPLSFMTYALILSLSFRGIWYQTFAYYKTLIVWLILEFFIIIFTEFKANNNQSDTKQPLALEEKASKKFYI